MRIAAGFELAYECERPTPMVLMLSPHPSRSPDLLSDVGLSSPRASSRGTSPTPSATTPPASWRPSAPRRSPPVSRCDDSGRPDEVAPQAQQHPIEELPDEALVFLLGSRYCETDRLRDVAWSLFGAVAARMGAGAGGLRLRPPPHHLRLPAADATRTASARSRTASASAATTPTSRSRSAAASTSRRATAPATSATSASRRSPTRWTSAPGSRSGWRPLVRLRRPPQPAADRPHPDGAGRDATDVALSTSYGSARLVRFEVVTDEIAEEAPALARLAS